jgi:hypothetical protein
MRTTKFLLSIILTGQLFFISCGEGKQEVSNQTTTQVLEVVEQKVVGLNAEFLGNYHGVQPAYNMKNQYGDDMIVAGNKIAVPSSDFKFLLKEDNIVSLQQTNLEDNSRTYYEGSFKITDDATDVIKIECSLNDGKSSSPTYNLVINKSDKKTNCIGNSEPDFILEKIN